MSRDWLLYLDDLIASAEKVGRPTAGKTFEQFVGDEAVIGEAIKKLPESARDSLSEAHRRGPARLRDLIAHHYFALDPDILWDVAQLHVPALCTEARALRDQAERGDFPVT